LIPNKDEINKRFAAIQKRLRELMDMIKNVDYYAWKRMPQRGAPDRIARYGQGFSKLLSNLQFTVDGMGNPSLHESLDYPNQSPSPMKNHNFRKGDPLDMGDR